MLPVRLAQILMQQDPVDNREHRVYPIDRQEHDIRDVSRLENQQPEQEDDDECRPDTTHIPRKALRFPFRAEVEVAEHQIRQDGHDDQALWRKPHPGIQPGQGQQNRQGITPIHPVDAIHEIIGIRDAHAKNQAQNHDPPALPIQDPPAREHQEHRNELHHQSHTIRQRVDVIHETDARRQRDSHDKRPVFKPEKRRKQPNAQHIDDAPAPEHHFRVRAALVRLVNDIAFVCNLELDQFCRYEQDGDDDVCVPHMYCFSMKYEITILRVAWLRPAELYLICLSRKA